VVSSPALQRAIAYLTNPRECGDDSRRPRPEFGARFAVYRLQGEYGVEFPDGSTHRPVVALTAYLDAGVNRDSIALCGYVSSDQRWKRFSRLWNAALLKADPLLDYFHMTDFEAAKSRPYRDWSESKRYAVLNRLLTLIGETAMVGSVVAVVKNDFEALHDADKRRLGGIYSMCASMVIGQTMRWAHDENLSQTIAYVFELGDKGSKTFADAMQDLLSRSVKLQEHILSITFENKRRFPGPQAADILAFEACRYLPIQAGIDSRPPRYPIKSLLGSVRHVGRWLDATALRDVLLQYTPEHRAAARVEFGVTPPTRIQKKRRPQARRREDP
jgi:hypothetical protein